LREENQSRESLLIELRPADDVADGDDVEVAVSNVVVIRRF